ncbi:zinc finger protein 25-like isoform X2 [Pleurodeles waltl]|uniref:zinc finger protein 25-like isoform X2 n=1 Tax=Pleurodeles waltl TaxID=8319 RepID=UPI0037096D60
MLRQESEKVPVTFRDVAACFSEQEWKVLHEWQKELYSHVMMQVHQVLTSLGYVIVNPTTLLRIYKGEEVDVRDALDPVGKAGANGPTSSCHLSISPDIILRIKQEEELFCSEPQFFDEKGFNNKSSKGEMIANSDLLFKIKREESLYLSDSQDLSENESKAHHGAVIIKEEEDSCSVGRQGFSGDKLVNMSTVDGTLGDRTTKRKKEDGYSLKCTEKTSYQHSPGKTKIKVLQIAESGRYSKCQLWSETKQEQLVEKTTQCASVYNKISSVNLHPGTSTLRKLATYESANNLRNTPLPISQQNPQRSGRVYTCTECQKIFYQKGHYTAHRRTHTGERPYQCTECGKKFCQKNNLTRHYRIHTGFRPHQCPECEKSFSRRGTLIIHQRKHTGERPYQCTKCNKTFCQRITLLRHQRTHALEQDYINM